MKEGRNQVIITIGVSGSGKSTWASKFVKDNPGWVRVNRDDLRKVLVGNLDGYYQRKDLNTLEMIVTQYSQLLIINLLLRDFNVIIDNTHLKPAYIEEIRAFILDKIPVDFKFKIFPLKDSTILKDRISARDSVDTSYIDKQIQSLPGITSYIEDNYKENMI